MRATSAQWASTIRRSHQRVARVQAFYDGQLTAELPVIDGSVSFDAFAPASRRCTVTVPLEYKGVNYNPGRDPLAPLATYGQRLLILAGVVHPDGTEEYVSQGWYVIDQWVIDSQQGTITVTGSDLWTLLDRAPVLLNNESMRLPWILANRIESLVGRLLYPRLIPNPLPELPAENRILEASIGIPPGRFLTVATAMFLKEGDSRTSALLELATAWPAQMRVNDDGLLRCEEQVQPPTGSTPVDVELTDAAGANPVLVTRTASSQRDKVYNCIILTSRSANDGGTIARSHRQFTSGPFRCQGPYGYHPIVQELRFITSQAELSAISAARLTRMIMYAMTEQLEVVPNPAIELDDVALISTQQLGTFKGRITGITMPLAVTGPMTITVSNSDATQAAQALTEVE